MRPMDRTGRQDAPEPELPPPGKGVYLPRLITLLRDQVKCPLGVTRLQGQY